MKNTIERLKERNAELDRLQKGENVPDEVIALTVRVSKLDAIDLRTLMDITAEGKEKDMLQTIVMNGIHATMKQVSLISVMKLLNGGV